jgi:hypothetical protein
MKKSCQVEIYEQAWTNTRDLLSNECSVSAVGVPLSFESSNSTINGTELATDFEIISNNSTLDESNSTIAITEETPRRVGSIMKAVGSFVDRQVDAKSIEIAQWATKSLSAFTGLNGFKHTYKAMSQLQTKTVAGTLKKKIK